MQSKYFVIASLVIITMLSISCGKTSTQTLDEMITTGGKLEWSGNFRGYGSQKVSGQAKIYMVDKNYMLKLENFSTSNGPDLKVYLSKAASPSDNISLGDLKSTNGNQVFPITGSPDFSAHRFVLIHCERYNHLYGSAELMK
jgi:hypothetical protein